MGALNGWTLQNICQNSLNKAEDSAFCSSNSKLNLKSCENVAHSIYVFPFYYLYSPVTTVKLHNGVAIF